MKTLFSAEIDGNEIPLFGLRLTAVGTAVGQPIPGLPFSTPVEVTHSRYNVTGHTKLAPDGTDGQMAYEAGIDLGNMLTEINAEDFIRGLTTALNMAAELKDIMADLDLSGGDDNDE